jgi:hypothetical protein
MEYDAEMKALEEYQASKSDSTWWNATPGAYKVKILTEGREYETKYKEEVLKKIAFDIEIDGEKYVWGVSKGKTFSSTFGQLMLVGKQDKQLAGKTLTVVVMQDKKRDGSTMRKFTIVEAADIMKKHEAQIAAIKQAGVATPVSATQNNTRKILDGLKGSLMTKEDLMKALSIDEAKLNLYVETGLLSTNGGNTYKIE